MRFVPLDPDAYERFASSTRHRIFIPQLPEFARVRARQGYRVEYVGVVEGATRREERVVGAAVLVYQPWRRFLLKARLTYGPLLDWDDEELVDCFFDGLKRHVKRNPRVVSITFNPLVPRAFYEDIRQVAENPQARKVADQLAGLGARRLTKEFYERPDIQIRYIYTKSVEGMSFEEATATLAKGLRRRFHNEGRYGVTTRFLPPEDFGVFDSLHESTAERTNMHEITSGARELYTGLMRETNANRHARGSRLWRGASRPRPATASWPSSPSA